MLLSEFLKDNGFNIKIKDDFLISQITDNSQEVDENSIFVVIRGINHNGLDYLDEVLKKRVKMIIIDEDQQIDEKYKFANFIKIKDVKKWYLNFLLKINKAVLDKLKIIGITGTNGKTTSSYLVYKILRKYRNTMLTGTNGTYVYEKNKEIHYDTKNTTPKLSVILDILNKHRNIKYLIIEVSSDAVDNERLGDLRFDIIGLTNIGHDHVNTHKTYENYINSKIKLFSKFKNNGLKVAVINQDDKHSEKFISSLMDNIKLSTYGINKGMLKGDILSICSSHMMIKVVDKEHEMTLGTNLLGRFNVYNILLAIKICDIIGIPFTKIIDFFSTTIKIDGRYNKYQIENRDVYIDYAHNPEAVREFLCLINQITDNKILTVIGAGGCRDKLKRSKMGLYASMYSDILILTEDSSRTEDINDIINGLKEELIEGDYIIELDRPTAIKMAFSMSEEKDVIVLLGMGNDKYGKDNEFTDYIVINSVELNQ